MELRIAGKWKSGLSNFDYVEIKSGLQKGESVVLTDMSQFENLEEISIQIAMKKRYFYFLLIIFCSHFAQAQVQRISLTEVVQHSQGTICGFKAGSDFQKKTNYWQYRSFMADFKPQLSLNGTIPGFTNSYIQVVQPDGTVSFQSVSNNNSVVNLSLNQSIALTGGTIYVQQQMQRFDNFAGKTTSYNGIPFEFGITQPLFRFNAMKWNRKIEPLKYQEGNQQYIASLEQVALDATGLYFDLLVAQVNLQIAGKNRSNNDTLYKIAGHKLELGKISQNDLVAASNGTFNSSKRSGFCTASGCGCITQT